jgi:hypothetical protein
MGSYGEDLANCRYVWSVLFFALTPWYSSSSFLYILVFIYLKRYYAGIIHICSVLPVWHQQADNAEVSLRSHRNKQTLIHLCDQSMDKHYYSIWYCAAFYVAVSQLIYMHCVHSACVLKLHLICWLPPQLAYCLHLLMHAYHKFCTGWKWWLNAIKEWFSLTVWFPLLAVGAGVDHIVTGQRCMEHMVTHLPYVS